MYLFWRIRACALQCRLAADLAHFLSIEPQTASVDRCAFITLLCGGRALHAAAGLFYLIAVAVNL